jgi:hypothetical protein
MHSWPGASAASGGNAAGGNTRSFYGQGDPTTTTTTTTTTTPLSPVGDAQPRLLSLRPNRMSSSGQCPTRSRGERSMQEVTERCYSRRKSNEPSQDNSKYPAEDTEWNPTDKDVEACSLPPRRSTRRTSRREEKEIRQPNVK